MSRACALGTSSACASDAKKRTGRTRMRPVSASRGETSGSGAAGPGGVPGCGDGSDSPAAGGAYWWNVQLASDNVRSDAVRVFMALTFVAPRAPRVTAEILL